MSLYILSNPVSAERVKIPNSPFRDTLIRSDYAYSKLPDEFVHFRPVDYFVTDLGKWTVCDVRVSDRLCP